MSAEEAEAYAGEQESDVGADEVLNVLGAIGEGVYL